jgi:hypothetical protein
MLPFNRLLGWWCIPLSSTMYFLKYKRHLSTGATMGLMALRTLSCNSVMLHKGVPAWASVPRRLVNTRFFRYTNLNMVPLVYLKIPVAHIFPQKKLSTAVVFARILAVSPRTLVTLGAVSHIICCPTKTCYNAIHGGRKTIRYDGRRTYGIGSVVCIHDRSGHRRKPPRA